MTNFYRQVQSVLLWDTRNSKPQIGRDVALQSRDEGKVCAMKNMKKEGYQEGLLEIEEKHQNAAVEAMEEVNNVAPLGRIEEVMMKEPSESDVVEAGCCAAKNTTANVHKMHKKYEMLTFAVLLPENLGWS